MKELGEAKQAKGGKKKKKGGQNQKTGKYDVHPKEKFLLDKKYSKFDSDGIPTHYKNGTELDEKARQKQRDFLASYTKKYNQAHQQVTQLY